MERLSAIDVGFIDSYKGVNCALHLDEEVIVERHLK